MWANLIFSLNILIAISYSCVAWLPYRFCINLENLSLVSNFRENAEFKLLILCLMFIILGCLEHFSNDQRTGSVWDVLDMRYIWVFGKLQSFDNIFFKGINSTQGWTATTRHGITRKKIRKRLNRTGNLFRKNVHLKGVF